MAIASRSATLRAAAASAGAARTADVGSEGEGDIIGCGACGIMVPHYTVALRHILSSCPATVPEVEFDNISGRQLIAEPASRAGPGPLGRPAARLRLHRAVTPY